ncbi:MAG: hypothetical protein ACYDBJ_26780 [Aggregatilineales bacterium]
MLNAKRIGLISGVLPIAVWWMIASKTSDSGDEVLGLLIYGALAFSILADLIYLWKPDDNLRQAVQAFELGLRSGTAIALISALFTFLPAPGYQIEPLLLAAIVIVALIFILEARWRCRLMIRISSSNPQSPRLIDNIGGAALVIIFWRALLITTIAISYGIVALVLSAIFPDPLRAQTVSVILLLALPLVIVLMIYLFYRWLYSFIAIRAGGDTLRHLFNLGRILWVTLLAGMVIIAAAIAPGFIASGTSTPTATVTIDSQQPGKPIAADFLGLSFEAPVLTRNAFASQNTILAHLLDTLGRGTLRFGGNEVEYTGWQPDSVGASTALPIALGTADLDRVFAFAQRVRWRVILGVNLGHFDPASAADEAAYAVRADGSALLAIEIGNEPDLFMFNGQRSPLWGYSGLRNELQAYIQAIHARAPDAPIAAPVTYGTTGIDWFRQIMTDDGAQLTLATHHLYPMTRLPVMLWGSPTAPTIDNLLSPAVIQRTAATVDELVRASPLPLQISETNSVANSGKSGVSDVFAAALWGADHLFTLAEHGVRGVNFHTVFSRCYGYTPICLDGATYRAQPLYYALLLFHTATQGAAQTVPVHVESNTNLAAHAIIGADGKLRIVLINKRRIAVTVHLAATQSYLDATYIRLTAPTLESTAGITLGGESVNADGQWQPNQSIPLGGDTLTIDAASAVVITFAKR